MEPGPAQTKSAGYYYFSYRRLFGHVDIGVVQNAKLNEKAGREGFRENRAYRQFTAILSNFFVQIAADFFRQGGAEYATFQEVHGELERAEQVRRDREEKARARRAQFETGLAKSSEALSSGEVGDAVDEVVATLRKNSRIRRSFRRRCRYCR